MKIRYKCIVLLLVGFIEFCHSKVVINVRIYNYQNENDIKHDGWKCETFHWANDNCDPIFAICITAQTRCDILKRSIEHWKNKKYISTVLQKTVKLDTIKRSFNVEVRVDDHDKLDSHDHIAMFNSRFDIANLNENYRKAMTVSPSGLSVVLYASITMQCDLEYYGNDCEVFCQPISFNYDCNTTTGSKKCILDCGPHGSCDWNPKSNKFICKCLSGWTGDQCTFSEFPSCSTFHCELVCSYSSLYKYCTCKSKPDSPTCQELVTIKPTTVEEIKTTPTVARTTLTSLNIKSATAVIVSTTESQKAKNFTADSKRSEIILQSHYSPTTIAFMCILIFLCVCVIALGFVIRGWRKKDKFLTNGIFAHTLRAQRPLPPVVYKPNLYSNTESGTIYASVHLPKSPESQYDLCTVQSDSRSEVPLIKFDNYKEDVDNYEIPNDPNNNTCEVDLTDGDDDSLYEMPRKQPNVLN